MTLNEILGIILFVLGALMIVISLVAFVKVQFFSGTTRGLKDLNETLAQVNALLKNWQRLLLLVPPPLRHIFWLLTIGGVFIAAGLYLLIGKPI
jgi:hypothetical protein